MWQPKAFADTWQRTGTHTHTHTLRLMRFATHVCCFWSVSAVYIICFFLQSVAAMTWCIFFVVIESLFTFVATLIYNKIFREHVATMSKKGCVSSCVLAMSNFHHQSPSITMHGNPWFHPQAPAVRTELEKAQGWHWGIGEGIAEMVNGYLSGALNMFYVHLE